MQQDIDNKIADALTSDFERYVISTQRTGGAFGLNEFVRFSSSLINFYMGSEQLGVQQRKSAAAHLCVLFNLGIQNRITAQDLETIAQLIVQDELIDYELIKPIFDGE